MNSTRWLVLYFQTGTALRRHSGRLLRQRPSDLVLTLKRLRRCLLRQQLCIRPCGSGIRMLLAECDPTLRFAGVRVVVTVTVMSKMQLTRLLQVYEHSVATRTPGTHCKTYPAYLLYMEPGCDLVLFHGPSTEHCVERTRIFSD